MTDNLIDEIEKYIPKSMALYDKELLLDNIKIILDEHKFTTSTSPAVKGVDELIEKYTELHEAEQMVEAGEVLEDLQSFKQTPVASECKHECDKYVDADGVHCERCTELIGPTTEEIIKDYKPKEVKPIYDAKDPESNRKHIIENMCLWIA